MFWSDASPLANVKVLDLCRVVSGPFATMQLGDLGADVVKVEEPGRGDESRSYGPPCLGGESAYFLSVNRNKRSCAIDLKSMAGREIVLRLAATADVVVENFRPGTVERLGLGFDALQQINQRLVFCSVSGFGRTGADAQRPGYDLVIQGESGLMDVTGEPEGAPMKVGTSIADLVTGLYACQAVLSGLRQRDRTGRGGRIDVSMLDAMASLLTFNAGIYFATGQSPRRRGNAHPTISPYETFEVSDGWINVAVANNKFWTLFCDAIKRPDLGVDPRFADAPDRTAHRLELGALLQPIFLTQPRHHWSRLLGNAGIPCGEIRAVGEVCKAPQLVGRGVIRDHDHPIAGCVHYLASPLRFGDEAPPDATRPPLLGEHTDEVLSQWLGFCACEIRSYSSKGAFGSPRGGGRHSSGECA
jgi:crotonobetainyl-CoA:carnitine CoA-transferase CaiB-like acyl-CoA transferase